MPFPIRHPDEPDTDSASDSFPVPDPPPHGSHTARIVDDAEDNFPVPDPPPHSGF